MGGGAGKPLNPVGHCQSKVKRKKLKLESLEQPSFNILFLSNIKTFQNSGLYLVFQDTLILFFCAQTQNLSAYKQILCIKNQQA